MSEIIRFQNKETMAQNGFVLPLVLALIAAISYLLAATLEQVASIHERAQISNQKALQAISDHATEQEIIYRALLERYGRQVSFINLDQVTYSAPAPTADWRVDSVPFVWRGIYLSDHYQENVDPLEKQYTVRIQDAAGLFSINFPNLNYLTFLADFLDLPKGNQRQAARDLYSRLLEMRQAEGDTITRHSGFRSTAAICEEPYWKEARICLDDDNLLFAVTANRGSFPNPTSMPIWLKNQYIPNWKNQSDVEIELDWRDFSLSLGVNELLGSGAKGTLYIVGISDDQAPDERQFVLNLLYDLNDRPYSIYERSIAMKREIAHSNFGDD